MRKKTDQQNDNNEEAEEYTGVEELTEQDGLTDPSYTFRMQEFLMKANLDIQPVFYLYRYENYNSGDLKAIIAKYKDGDPPDEDDIGRMYGSGRYLLLMSIPKQPGTRGKSKVQGYRFRVHPTYDKLKNAPVPFGANVAQPYPVIQQQAGNGFSDAIAILERLMTVMVPMFNQPKDDSIQDVLSKSYDVMGDVMRKNMLGNVSMINEFQKQLALAGGGTMNFDTEVEEEEEQAPSLVEQIAPFLTEWLPKIIGNTPQAKVAQQAVKMTPQFRQVIKDRAEFIKLVQYLDQTTGTEKTDKVLTALQIKRPGVSARRKAPAAKKKV